MPNMLKNILFDVYHIKLNIKVEQTKTRNKSYDSY